MERQHIASVFVQVDYLRPVEGPIQLCESGRADKVARQR